MLGFLNGDGVTWLRGRGLVAAITSVCSTGFLLFGYDMGVMSGVIMSPSWLETMGNPDDVLIGTMTALFNVGAIMGAVAAAVTSEWLGRKRTLLLSALLMLGASLAMGLASERGMFMGARIVLGIGCGMTTSVTPVYQSEIGARTQRGWQVCCQLTTMLCGLTLAYWINYLVYFGASGDVQWRFPLILPCVFALYVVIVTPLLPDTPRWLLRHHPAGPDRGTAVLARLRGLPVDAPSVSAERDSILDAIALERPGGSSGSDDGGGLAAWADLFRSNGVEAHKRFYLAVGIQFMQQMTGINIVTYYTPTLYTTSLRMSEQRALFLGGFTQLWYLAASLVTWYTIDRVGRRKLFISMALAMALVLVGEAVSVAAAPAPVATVAAVVFIFLFEACFTWGWMACVWIYPPEILPLRIRAPGAALAAAADFVGNFIVVQVTPVALARIGSSFYVVWAVLNVVNAVVVWLFYPETGGLPLEAVDEVFTRALDGEWRARKKGLARFQWARVHVAAEMGRETKVVSEASSSNS